MEYINSYHITCIHQMALNPKTATCHFVLVTISFAHLIARAREETRKTRVHAYSTYEYEYEQRMLLLPEFRSLKGSGTSHLFLILYILYVYLTLTLLLSLKFFCNWRNKEQTTWGLDLELVLFFPDPLNWPRNTYIGMFMQIISTIHIHKILT